MVVPVTEYIHMHTKEKLVTIIILLGIIAAELGNSFLTYGWYFHTPFRHWEKEVYSIAEYADNAGEILLKIALCFSVKLLSTSKILRAIALFYIDTLALDLFYCTFFNPFTYHLDKDVSYLLTIGIYIVQYGSWKYIKPYRRFITASYFWIISKLDRHK